MNTLVHYIKSLQGPGMVYFSSKKWAEIIAERIRSENIARVAYYHGGLESEDRLQIQAQFLNDQLDVICCTNAFGMGINKKDIRYIIHFHYPVQMESYLQEIGRAGRDRKSSIAIVLHSYDDQYLPLSLIDSEFPDFDQLDHTIKLLVELEQKQNLLSKQHEQLIVEETGITESMWRLIRYHLEQAYALSGERLALSGIEEKFRQKMITFISDRKAKKVAKLQEVETWLETKSCRRDAYLHLFDEEKTVPIENCCDICGINEHQYFATNQNSSYETFLLSDWKLELKMLLHQKD
ncbi:helicase-related protein [Desertibacillus haloalkaliphilus]|uniref:helicase-related protein n=1 Tax=Desertibacillus haloalkaliphilus TaxID=1328930 RepID=UPI001C264EA2|nr:helicase-related protein [Desertibacillus haloalkaliphilus]